MRKQTSDRKTKERADCGPNRNQQKGGYRKKNILPRGISMRKYIRNEEYRQKDHSNPKTQCPGRLVTTSAEQFKLPREKHIAHQSAEDSTGKCSHKTRCDRNDSAKNDFAQLRKFITKDLHKEYSSKKYRHHSQSKKNEDMTKFFISIHSPDKSKNLKFYYGLEMKS